LQRKIRKLSYFSLQVGGTISADQFYAACRPLQEKILRDNAIIAKNPTGSRAQQLDGMSLSDYLSELAHETSGERSIFAKAWNGTKRLC